MIGKIVHYVDVEGKHEASIIVNVNGDNANLQIFHDHEGIGYGKDITKSAEFETNTWHEVED